MNPDDDIPWYIENLVENNINVANVKIHQKEEGIDTSYGSYESLSIPFDGSEEELHLSLGFSDDHGGNKGNGKDSNDNHFYMSVWEKDTVLIVTVVTCWISILVKLRLKLLTSSKRIEPAILKCIKRRTKDISTEKLHEVTENINKTEQEASEYAKQIFHKVKAKETKVSEMAISTDSQLMSSERSLDEINVMNTSFQQKLSAQAELISRSGLNKEKALEIVSVEAVKNMINDQKEIVQKLEKKAKEAKENLGKAIKDITCGAHFFLCIILGCGTRIICIHKDILYYLLNNNLNESVFNLIHEWTVINVCSCFVNDQKFIIHQDNDSMENKYFFWTNIFLTYISSYFNTSPLLGQCFLQICSHLIILSLTNRFLTMLHIPILHYVFNTCLLIVGILSTSTGRSFISLIFLIFITNGILGAWGFYLKFTYVVDEFHLKRDKKISLRKDVEDRLSIAMHDLEKMRNLMYIVSTLTSLILGYYSFLTK